MILIKTKEYNVNGTEFIAKLWLRSLTPEIDGNSATFAIGIKSGIFVLHDEYNLVDCTIAGIEVDDFLFDIFYEAYLGSLSFNEFTKVVGVSGNITILHNRYKKTYSKVSKLFSLEEIKELYEYFF